MVACAALRRPRSIAFVHARFSHGGFLPSQKMDAQEESSSDPFWVRTLCQHGQLGQSINLLYSMHAPPSPDTYLFLLKACNYQKALSQTRRVHAHLARHELLLSGFLGDYLAMTLARCGALEDALDLFFSLPGRTVYSWTAIMSACTECGQGEEAHRLYRCMLADGVEPDAYTFVCLFKACGCTLDLDLGKELHSNARKRGFTTDVYVGNTLMSMYGKCEALEEAEDVFRGLVKRNIVSWCVMLTAYVEQGHENQALQLYRQMFEEDIQPDRLASMVVLQACGLVADNEEFMEKEGQSTMLPLLQIGQAIHADAYRKGFVSDVYFNSALVNMYGKGGSMMEAEHAFQALSQRNIVTWNAMLSACLEQGLGEKTLWFYIRMQQEGVSPDQLTLLFTFQACGILAANENPSLDRELSKRTCLEIGQALHADACKRGFAFDAVLGSALLIMYGKCKALMQVDYMFVLLSERNIVAWNAMLTIYVEQGLNDEALMLYRQLQEENVSPDELSFAISFQACAGLAEKDASNLEIQSNKMLLGVGRCLHSDARRRGFDSGLPVGNALLKFYTKCGSLAEAEQVFDMMPQPNLVSWNVILRAYVDEDQADRALQFFAYMQRYFVIHDDVTLISVIQACGATGSLEISKYLHFHAASVEYEHVPTVAATTIHTYGCCASMADAEALLDGLSDPHVAAWNACISGHAGDGNYMASYCLFEMLKLAGLMPSVITFTSLLSVCSHSGLLIEALECFESLCVDFRLTIDSKHIAIMVDLLGRIGDFTKIDDMFGWIQSQADLSAFLCLLGACRVHGNLQLAERIFDCAAQFYPEEASLYVLMSNMYADAGLHNPSVQVENFLPKQLDLSLLELST
ncbi:hypothetical protein GOP47_0004453 [Adiantum capillus-veneris]|uniref:Pentatricopeptide repeat-containing protein n=1 Tax=Adiantum capillus-veneris TaxID=13818 RepID=A0A9D4V7I1_ADICA|nr:hypothetical protein GOP47_0004453 [Adiantum capillus-veneris]